MKIVAVTQARMSSSRLPGKVLREIDGKTLLEIHLKRILQSKLIDELIIATSINKDDDTIEAEAKRLGVSVFRGSLNDVLDRFYQAVLPHKPDYVVRLTADCPLIDPTLIDGVVEQIQKSKADYCSNTLKVCYPDGMDVEVFKFSALEIAWQRANLLSEREHVTPYIYKNSDFQNGELFKAVAFCENIEGYNNVRLTVDEQTDLLVIENLVKVLGTNCQWQTYANYYCEHPEVNGLNSQITRNEGYSKSIEKDNL